VRIVSLCPSLTELVFDLGRGDELVGVTDYCVHPERGVAAIEKLGGTKTPKIARILELAPDIVLLNEEENRREDSDALREAGVCCHVSFPKDAIETAAMVRDIGGVLERRAEAERIASDIEQRAERVRRDARDARPVRWAYLIWRKPWMAVNDDTFASALLSLAGGRNVFGDSRVRYPEITPAELAAREPELVLLCTEPFPFDERHIDELASMTKLPRAHFRIADGEYLSWHGSRTPAGIDYAESLIRGARG
jgi:ABC-type Fe3+-hydroxamate transport system substrate-binding protein